MNSDYHVRRLMALSMWGGFYYCPTTGRIREALPGDNKMLCPCGRSNPKCLTERAEDTFVHVIAFLEPATVEAYLEQQDTTTLRDAVRDIRIKERYR